LFFFFQAEDGIRDFHVTGVQTCALPILGDGEALILRNHGLVTVGRTIGEAFNWMHRLELSARSQLAAMATGAQLVQVPKAVVERSEERRVGKERRARWSPDQQRRGRSAQ